MNNKGQTLVLFVIILPIILIIFTLVVDLGLLYIEKRNISNNIDDALDYYLKYQNDEKTRKLLVNNINDIEEINIEDNSSYVEITVVKKYKGLYRFSYSDIINNENIKITRVKNKL